MQFEAGERDVLARYNGAVRVARVLVLKSMTDGDPDTLYGVVCLNGSAHNGLEFTAYEKELSR